MPTDDQIAAAIAGDYGAVSQSWRIERCGSDGLPLGGGDVSDYFIDGTISVRNAEAVRGEFTGSFAWTLDDGNPFVIFDTFLVTEERMILGERVDFPRGVWILIGIEVLRDEEGRTEAALTFQDQTSALAYTTTTEPITYPAGTFYLDAMGSILDFHGYRHDLVWVGDDAPPALPVDWQVPENTDHYTILRTLAEGINYKVPYPDPTGQFVTGPVLDPFAEPSAVRIADDDEPGSLPFVALPAISVSGDVADYGSIPNEVLARIDDPRRRGITRVVQTIDLAIVTSATGVYLDIDLSADGSEMWAISSSTIYRIDIATQTVISSFAAVSQNRGIALEPAGAYFWISDQNGNLYRRAVADGSIDDTVDDGVLLAGPIAITPDGVSMLGKFALITDSVAVVPVGSPAGGSVRDVNFQFYGLAADPDGVNMWVSGVINGTWTITKWPITSGAQLVSFVGPASSGGLAVVPDGAHIWSSGIYNVPFNLGAAYLCETTPLSDYGAVRYRNEDPASDVSTAHRSPNPYEIKSASKPSTAIVHGEAVLRDIAVTQLQRHASGLIKVGFETFPDPRRWYEETVTLAAHTIGEGKATIREWSHSLSPGESMVVQAALVMGSIEITEVT